jgi:hypothetical protein
MIQSPEVGAYVQSPVAEQRQLASQRHVDGKFAPLALEPDEES